MIWLKEAIWLIFGHFGPFLNIYLWYCSRSLSKIYYSSWNKSPLFVAILEIFMGKGRKNSSAHACYHLYIYIIYIYIGNSFGTYTLDFILTLPNTLMIATKSGRLFHDKSYIFDNERMQYQGKIFKKCLFNKTRGIIWKCCFQFFYISNISGL